MKFFKKLVLAMVATAAAMAVLGAASASADTACTSVDYETECAVANRYAGAVKAELKEGEAIFELSPITAKCKKSTLEGKVTVNGGLEVEGELTGASFTECTGCNPVEAEALPWKTSWNWLEFNSATDQQQDEFKATSIKIVMKKCGANALTCTATGSPVLPMHTTGPNGNPKNLTWFEANTNLTLGGGGCPTSAKWKATYKLVTPTNLFISQKP